MLNLRRKLKSENGASLTFALIIFLVCAVVGSVVLTAGTTAAGRFSKLTEMDKRYYNVMSAVNLLSEELSGKEVKIIREKKTEDTISTTYVVDAGPGGGLSTTETDSTSETTATYNTYINPDDEMTPTYTKEIDLSDYHVVNDGDPIIRDTLSFLTARAVYMLFGEQVCNTDAAMEYSLNRGNAEPESTFQMRHSVEPGKTEISDDDLLIKGTYELTADGKIIFVLEDGSSTEHYAMRMIMNPVIEETSSVSDEGSDEEASVVYTENGYTETLHKLTTEQKISKIKWVSGGIETVSSAHAVSGTP